MLPCAAYAGAEVEKCAGRHDNGYWKCDEWAVRQNNTDKCQHSHSMEVRIFPEDQQLSFTFGSRFISYFDLWFRDNFRSK